MSGFRPKRTSSATTSAGCSDDAEILPHHAKCAPFGPAQTLNSPSANQQTDRCGNGIVIRHSH